MPAMPGTGRNVYMKVTVDPRFFNAAYRPYLQDTHRYQLFFGGAGSGKSVFLASRCVLDCLMGRNILVVRQVARTLRHSCMNEIIKAADRMQLSACFRVNRTDGAMTCRHNGAQILFAGLDDTEKLKSITPRRGVLTDIWLEEATECDYHSFKQLDKRLRGRSRFAKRFTFSFNPIDREHWLYREFFDIFPDGERSAESELVTILKTTYLDNRFLTDDDRHALEREKDPYYLSVYTHGEWGVREGAVFTNWRTAHLTGEEAGESRFGLDFGFAHDPAALVHLRYDRKKGRIYVLEEMKLKNLTNPVLAAHILQMARDAPVFCDSAEPKSIMELRALGVNAHPVRKGPGSIQSGLRFLQGKEIWVSAACPEMRRELAAYVWQKDKDGRTLPIPRGGNDHLIDAMRYALENDASARFIRTGSKRELGL
ncbi:MAG: PBSX family phage terminase large subunit [Clostridiales bacterium]|nr:PBSX family phage terminase large subunit [Clostridiales bacterium]